MFQVLAVILAVIATAIGFVSHNELARLLAIVLTTIMMIVVPLTVYFLRRRNKP